MVTATPHEDVQAAYGQPPDMVASIIDSVLDYGRACADELPDSQQMWLDDIRERLEGLQYEAYADGRKEAEEERIPVPPRAIELLVRAMEFGHELWHGGVSKEDCEGMGFNLKFSIKEYLQEVGYLMKDKK